MMQQFLIILGAGAFIRNEDGRFLIVKKSPEEKIDGGIWTVPGGKIDPEENIVEGLKREVREETGLIIKSFQWIGEDVFEAGGHWFHGEHFLCTVEDSTKIILEKKLLEFRWISKEEINAYEFHPNIKKRLHQVLES